jgi:hypothetical protein
MVRMPVLCPHCHSDQSSKAARPQGVNNAGQQTEIPTDVTTTLARSEPLLARRSPHCENGRQASGGREVMEPTSLTHLEARVFAHATAMMTPGNLPSLCHLSRTDFVHVLTHALSLKGLDRYHDADARATLGPSWPRENEDTGGESLD